MSSRRSRREFLQVVAGAATAAPTLLHAQRPTASRARSSPNDRIRVGIIGVGIRGQQDLRSALRAPGVELTAAADVYDGRLDPGERAVGQPGVHDARLSRGAGAAGRRRRDHRGAGSLAHADGRRRDAGRQGRVCREADGAGARRRPAASSMPRGRPAESCRSAVSMSARSSTRRRESCSAPARSAS